MFRYLEENIKKDSWAFGAIMAFVAPILTLFLVHYFFMGISALIGTRPFEMERFYLLSVSVNLLLMRYYLVSIKYVKTGKSILAVTFAIVIMFFVFFHNG